MSIYVLSHNKNIGSDYETEFSQIDIEEMADAPKCEVCGEYIGMMKWMPPYEVEIEVWGRQFGDWLFGPGGDCLVSERFMNLWKENGLVGLSGFEKVLIRKVKKHKKTTEDVTNYYKIDISHAQVSADFKKSGFKWDVPPSCEACKIGENLRGWRKIVLDTEEIKENVFYANGLPGTVLADEIFKKFCEKYSMRNCALVPAESYENWFGLSVPSEKLYKREKK